MKSNGAFNTAANAPYRFEQSDDPSLNDLHQQIAALTRRYVSEKELIALIKAAPAAAQTKFYAGFKLGTQNFMIERGALKAGSDDDLAMLANAQPPEFFDSPDSFEFESIALTRGLVKTLDVFYARTPGAAGMELRDMTSCFESLSMGRRLHPDFYIPLVPREEARQNYLRALDYLLAKEPDPNARNKVLEYQLIAHGHFTSLIPEFEKRGLNVDALMERYMKSYFNRKDGEKSLFTRLERYKRAKNSGLPIDDNLQSSEQTQTHIGYYNLLQGGASEDDLIAYIEAQTIDIGLHSCMSAQTIRCGLSRAQTALLRQCSHPHKDRLANDALHWVGRFFSPSEKPDPAHDQNILACLDVLIQHGANTQTPEGGAIILAAAMQDHLDLIPELAARGCDLGLAKGMASNIVEEDKKERALGYPVYSDGWGSHSAIPLTDEQIRRYTGLLNYALPASTTPIQTLDGPG